MTKSQKRTWLLTRELLAKAETSGDCGLADMEAVWRSRALPPQLPPPGRWRIWLLMGGRGAGKTRAGAEWIRGLVDSGAARRVALVAPTLHDAREVMIEGPSGVRTIANPLNPVAYSVTRRRLEWSNGAVGHVFSAEDPDSLRGPQFDAVWCDEIAAWAYDEKTWDTMIFGLRQGARPRVVATTTPQPRSLVRRLDGLWRTKRGGVVLTRAATHENAANLAPGFVEAMEESYRGTQLGRQELDGEMIQDLAGALFVRSWIEEGRIGRAELEEFGKIDGKAGTVGTPAGTCAGTGGTCAGTAGKLDRVVVAVDPPAGVGEKAAACGIVCAGKRGSTIYVLEDASVRGLRPAEWARRAVEVAKRNGAGVIVAEANQGGEMVREVIEREAKGEARVRLRHASKSKRDRAEPVSVEYEKGRVRHVGVMRELEDEMCSFGAPGAGTGPSPDRVDALVWAVSELMKPPVRPGIIAL